MKMNEASLSRVWKHVSDENTTVCILTAFRDETSEKDNISNNKHIATVLKSKKFGYFYLDGYWVENEGTENEVKVSEDSIFAICTEQSKSKEFIALCHKLGNRYDQDAIFVNEGNEVYLLNNDGSKLKLESSFKAGKMGKMYSKLKTGKHRNDTFIFEAERLGLGNIGSFKEYIGV